MTTTVFRVEKNREFVVMNHRFLREKEMSLKAKGLLALCLALPETWEYSINGLVAICKESQTAIRSTLKELEKFGYLKRNRKKDDKGQFYYEYVLYEVPYSGFEHAGKLDAENQKTEKAQAENVRQENNYLENTNIENKDYIEREKNPEEEVYEILEGIQDSELRELYTDYVIQRRENGHALTPKGLHMLIARGYRLSDSNMAVHRAIVETAIINQWMNLYEPRAEEKLGRNGYLEERKRYYLGDG